MNITAKLKEHWGWLAIVVAIFTTFSQFESYLDHRIERRLTDPVFVKYLNSKLRPNVIFDEQGTILNDSGGMEHIGEIRVVRSDKDKDDFIVTVRPKRFLSVEPLMEPLDSQFVVTARRGQGVDWVFTLDAINTYALESSATINHPERFRLELVP